MGAPVSWATLGVTPNMLDAKKAAIQKPLFLAKLRG